MREPFSSCAFTYFLRELKDNPNDIKNVNKKSVLTFSKTNTSYIPLRTVK